MRREKIRCYRLNHYDSANLRFDSTKTRRRYVWQRAVHRVDVHINILIEKGRVVFATEGISDAAECIDVAGKTVCFSLIDIHI